MISDWAYSIAHTNGWSFFMFKNLLILILIAILAVIGLGAAFKLLSWLIGVIVNIGVVVLAILGILFLVKKLRS
jgi:hypothetical protein